MAHEYYYTQVEIPELDEFLAGYRALCEAHGMQLAVEDYDYDGGHYITIELFDGCGPYIDLDKMDPKLPFVKRLDDAVEARRQREDAAEEQGQRAAAEENDKRECARLKAKFGDSAA